MNPFAIHEAPGTPPQGLRFIPTIEPEFRDNLDMVRGCRKEVSTHPDMSPCNQQVLREALREVQPDLIVEIARFDKDSFLVLADEIKKTNLKTYKNDLQFAKDEGWIEEVDEDIIESQAASVAAANLEEA